MENEALAFPQIQSVTDPDLRQKVARAVTFLNLENVDIGLFLLSKEFEATLKSCLVAASSRGKLRAVPGGEPAQWKLAAMIDCASKNNIISDRAVLHYLRQERNDRAHGSMPRLPERRALMRHCKYLAGMYIDYIAILDEYILQLTVDARSNSQFPNFSPHKDTYPSPSLKSPKRVGLFIDYENIIRSLPPDGKSEEVLIDALKKHASQFGTIVCLWVCADSRHLNNPTVMRLSWEKKGFNVRFPKEDLRAFFPKDITDFMLLECISDERSHSEPDIYIIVSGDGAYVERVVTLLDGEHIVRIVAPKSHLWSGFKRLQEQHEQLRQALQYPNQDFFIDDLNDIVGGAVNVSMLSAERKIPASSSKAHILFVDDEPNSISSFIRYFEKLGYSTEMAFDGRQALTHLRERQPDLIILDLAMPGMEGLEFVSRLRLEGNKVPIIVLTSHPDEDYADEAYEKGVNDFIYKGCRPSALLDRVKTHLSDNLK